MVAVQEFELAGRPLVASVNRTKVSAIYDFPYGEYRAQIYMETLETTKESMSGLSKLGLGNEKKLWGLQ